MLLDVPGAIATDANESPWISGFSRIETWYGRLVYLAALRNPDNGQYEHFGFTAGSAKSLIASRHMKGLHETVFIKWASFSLELKKADTDLYISSIDHIDKVGLIDAWLRLRPYLNLVPATVQGPERQRHISDCETILWLLQNLYGVASPD
jgi:hypothetical protein